MSDHKDLELVLNSKIPIIVIRTHEELQVMDLIKKIVISLNRPLFSWAVTRGLKRVDLDMGEQKSLEESSAVLRHIKSSDLDGIYVLLDFHPYIDDPINTRLLKEIALRHYKTEQHIVLVSHDIDIPDELHKLCAYFDLQLPDQDQLLQIVKDEAFSWSSKNNSKKVTTDTRILNALVRNLSGMTRSDAQRMARKVIFDDGAITETDLSTVMAAKHELLNKDGLLSFEYETEAFADVGGMARLKEWLELRTHVLQTGENPYGLQPPKGVLLLGVQGCGKSLVSKAIAGIFSVPLLRLDFGVLYNRFFGESEKNLRQALKTAEIMSPCVLWIDEIEKGLSTGDNDGGTSRRILGTLLTWMAENKQAVFIVATANDIEALPPELIRKGRFDEIFFVDLPKTSVRADIFEIHLRKRDMDPSKFDIEALAAATQGFSGAEIEQLVVAALYVVVADNATLKTEHLLAEAEKTRPLSVVMQEQIQYLRIWASERTVPVD